MSIEGRVLTRGHGWGGPGPIIAEDPSVIAATLEFPLQIAGPSSKELDTCDQVLSLQEDNTGVRLVVQALDEDGNPLDISSLESYRIRILKPDGSSEDFVAQQLTNGTDGKIFIDIEVSDLEQAGQYNIQGLFGLVGKLISTRVGQFTAESNIIAPGGS